MHHIQRLHQPAAVAHSRMATDTRVCAVGSRTDLDHARGSKHAACTPVTRSRPGGKSRVQQQPQTTEEHGLGREVQCGKCEGKGTRLEMAETTIALCCRLACSIGAGRQESWDRRWTPQLERHVVVIFRIPSPLRICPEADVFEARTFSSRWRCPAADFFTTRTSLRRGG